MESEGKGRSSAARSADDDKVRLKQAAGECRMVVEDSRHTHADR